MQIEYAALDAAVLVHIFHHVRGQAQSGAKEEQCKVEWKSHIVSETSVTNFSALLVLLEVLYDPILQVSRMNNMRRMNAL